MKDYYIGLDIGTDSVGWAVTDTLYNIKKYKGNAMWGIRLLDESHTADERRTFRGARRRVQRDKFRLECLEYLFSKEIAKVDISFFQRIKESNYTYDDKTHGSKYSLFNDATFKDYDYHRIYPTIYHLRRDLIDNSQPHDIRLVYLAVSHIIKNRGHFLFDSNFLGDNNTPDFSQIWTDLSAFLLDNYEIQLDCSDLSNVQDVLKNRALSITKRKEALVNEFGVSKKDEPSYSILSLLSGATVNSATLFSNEELKDTEASKITFSSGYDEKVSVYESVFGDDFELIEKLKAIYDWAVLADILKNQKYICYAKCYLYEKHKSDLRLLKSFVKKFIPEKYKIIFNENKSGVNNYPAYSGHLSKGSIEKKCDQIEFLDFLKKQLPKEPPTEEYAKMYNEISAYSFMPKIVNKDNSVIPMQVNRTELKAILKNASMYLGFLNEKDNSGKTVMEKILAIFSYRIPYYVGPLNNHSDKAWVVRTNEKIYPWNFNEVVDVDASAEKFIENLTNKCTYLFKEDVLPKNSLLYSKFVVLNELNNLKINGKEIPIELKQNIYNDLFLNNNKVTAKRLKNYLKSHNYGDVEITGIDGDFKNTLKVFRDFERYNLTNTEKDEIVKAITIFGDDKKLLKKRLNNKYADKLSSEEINSILKLKYSGWGRLSKKFLSGITGIDRETGEVDSIINFMWNTNNNLMQLLSSDYTFLDSIKEENGEQKFASLKTEIENLYVSPKVKRPIYQSMKIVEEIVKIMGAEPKKIFVEVAREDGEKGVRKESRKSKLLDLYKGLKKDNAQLYESLNNFEENEFRRDALYLYYTQMGRCMYSGEDIAVEDIFKRDRYDIDHIFPQSKIKDDSLDNRVLVKKVLNEEKGNTYPVDTKLTISEKVRKHWDMLRSKDLISPKKYERLTRNTPLTDDELSSFINRQIVETRQSTKAVAELLKKRYESDVVYVKANLVSDFRKKYDMLKSRDVNDLHHAKDAYLNIVVGNVYNTRFTKSFIKSLQDGSYSLNCMYDYDIKDAWIPNGENNSMDIVNKTMSKNNIRYTRYSSKQKGGLFDQNILKKGNGQVSVKKNSPLSDIEKYGGYNRATSTYFAIVKYTDKKGNALKSFVPVNLYDEHEYINNSISYITQELLKLEPDAKNVEILIPCVKYNSLISVNGYRMHISSKSNGGKTIVCKPAVQLVVGIEEERYVKKISKYLEKCKNLREIKEITYHDGISQKENIALYVKLKEKLNTNLFKVKFSKLATTVTNKEELFNSLSVYEQCVVLMEVLAILHANVRTGDLSLIGEAKKSGVVSIGNKISKNKDIQSFKIIHQSVTGLFEQEIELLD